MRGHPENVHGAGADLHHEQHIEPAQVDRVEVEEVGGEQAVRLVAQEPCQVSSMRRGAGPRPAAARMRRIVPAPARWPRWRSSPWICRCPQRGVFSGEADDQVADFCGDWWAAGLVRVSPLPGEEFAVPGQQRRRGGRCGVCAVRSGAAGPALPGSPGLPTMAAVGGPDDTAPKPRDVTPGPRQ
jgi:hypothetical protein